MDDDNTQIWCRDLVVRRGGFTLGPVEVALGRGVTTLVGRNGAGKTTLLRALVGLESARSGEVRILDQSGARSSERRIVARQVGYVAQAAGVPAGARVRDVVAYAAWLKAMPARRTATAVEAALAGLGGDHLQRRRVGTLSGGERQRVSIAMALVHSPTVLILDEPSVGLDPVQRVTLRRIIDTLAADRAVLVSTHLIEDVGGAADAQVLALEQGRLIFSGSPDDLRALARADDIGGTDLERGLFHLLGQEQA
ncbi:ABC transporter ATP-binding protein [Nocardioides stalactiti]|uniref:ABC transporter ATP-binding protein n=1 Tax=Nocardioides stalactiti TaxID=2755356 RepID=UPI0016026E78|nr:ATP-binding cassette domain-containing protein [Nocardioides stalactiti]